MKEKKRINNLYISNALQCLYILAIPFCLLLLSITPCLVSSSSFCWILRCYFVAQTCFINLLHLLDNVILLTQTEVRHEGVSCVSEQIKIKEHKGEAGKEYTHCGQYEYVFINPLVAQTSLCCQSIPHKWPIWQLWLCITVKADGGHCIN